MTSTFYIHLIATLINAFFIILLWWYNRKLINLNYDLMKDNRDILVEAKKLQERMNNIEANLPLHSLWIDSSDNNTCTRIAPLKKDNK